jgi:hypothetical protein
MWRYLSSNEQPIRYELAINLEPAKGGTLLPGAQEVIE